MVSNLRGKIDRIFRYDTLKLAYSFPQELNLPFVSNTLDQIKESVIPIFKQYGVSQAGVFGSYARGDDHPGSDIDFLIHLGQRMDLIQFIRLKAQLQDALGKRIDLVTDDTIIPYFEPDIRKDLITIYG
jgi:predicted nucleotidyltransferase